jgi:hypothetical protein
VGQPEQFTGEPRGRCCTTRGSFFGAGRWPLVPKLGTVAATIRDMALAVTVALSTIFCAELIVIAFISLGP